MMITIHQPQYLPWLGYFDKIHKSDVFVILDDVQYKKNDWQNRNRIKTAQGWQWLTVPVGFRFGQNIDEVDVHDTPRWTRNHMRAIELNYGKAPYFEQYAPGLADLYSRPWEKLCDVNIQILKYLLLCLNIHTKVVRSSDYNITSESTQRLVDLCVRIGADTYLAGADGDKYMDLEQFTAAGIAVKGQQYQHPEYHQIHLRPTSTIFIPNLSVIDLLFNHGPESLAILSRNQKLLTLT